MKKLILSFFSFFLILFSSYAQNANSLLWKITGKELKSPSYVFGTVHFYDTTIFKLPDTLFSLIKKCPQTAFELDFDKTAAGSLNIFIDDTSKTVKDFLSDSAYTKLQEIINNIPMLKLLGNKVYKMKPIFLSSFLYLPKDGLTRSVDLELFNFAKKNSRQIKGLETAKEQLASLNKLSDKEQSKYLEKAINDYGKQGEQLKDLLIAYKNQQGDSLMEKVEDFDASGNFNSELVVKRNVRLSDRAIELMKVNPVFIAIGAAHLPGKEGILSLLKEKGYTISPVKFNFSK